MDELDPCCGSFLIEEMRDSLSTRQIDVICSYRERRQRAQCFIDMVACHMTTEVYMDFMIALGGMPHVRNEISDAYWADGGCFHKSSPPCC